MLLWVAPTMFYIPQELMGHLCSLRFTDTMHTGRLMRLFPPQGVLLKMCDLESPTPLTLREKRRVIKSLLKNAAYVSNHSQLWTWLDSHLDVLDSREFFVVFSLKNQAICCCHIVDVATTNGTNLACWITVSHVALLFWTTTFFMFGF